MPTVRRCVGDGAARTPGTRRSSRASGSATRCASARCTRLRWPARPHRQQAHAVAPQRRHRHPPALEVGEKILAQGDDDLVAASPARRGPDRRRSCSSWRAMVPESGSLRDRRGLRGTRRPSGSALPSVNISSNWSKTKTGRTRRFCAVQNSSPVRWRYSQRVSRRRVGCSTPCARSSCNSQPDLLERGLRPPDLESDQDRQKALLSELRKDPGLEQRGLAEAGLAEEHRDRLVDDPAHSSATSGRTSAEEAGDDSW